MSYFILNCNNQTAGNPKGYRTIKGAVQQASSQKTKTHRALWNAFHVWPHRNVNQELVYRIEWRAE